MKTRISCLVPSRPRQICIVILIDWNALNRWILRLRNLPFLICKVTCTNGRGLCSLLSLFLKKFKSCKTSVSQFSSSLIHFSQGLMTYQVPFCHKTQKTNTYISVIYSFKLMFLFNLFIISL